MTYFDQMVYDGKFKEVEELIMDRVVSLEDLSELAFLIFKTWAESPKFGKPSTFFVDSHFSLNHILLRMFNPKK